MEKKITSLNKQADLLTNSVQEIKEIVEKLHHKNSTGVIDEYLRNMSVVIKGMEAKVNSAYLYYYYNRSKIDAINQNLSRQLQDVIEVVTKKSERNEDDRINKLIDEIFARKPEANETEETSLNASKEMIKLQSNETLETSNNCTSNVLNLIDVRSGFGCENADSNTEIQNVKLTPEFDEYEEVENYQQVTE